MDAKFWFFFFFYGQNETENFADLLFSIQQFGFGCELFWLNFLVELILMEMFWITGIDGIITNAKVNC